MDYFKIKGQNTVHYIDIKDLTELLDDDLTPMKADTGKLRIESITLEDGRKAEIQVVITTIENDMISKFN